MSSNPLSDNNAAGGGARGLNDIDFLQLDRETQIRCVADGELPVPQATAMAQDESAQRGVAFERTLRTRVASVMSGGAAPSELRAAVEAMFATEAPESQGEDLPVRQPVTVGPAATRTHAFWSRRNVLTTLAAAAVVGLVATVGVFVRNATAPVPRIAATLVSFLEQEHAKCSTFGPYFDQKMIVRNEQDAAAYVAAILETPISTLDLQESGYSLAGAGRCHVPGDGASVHAIYSALKSVVKGQQEAAPVSVFLQVATDDTPLFKPGVCYEKPCGENLADRLAVWRSGDLIYYIYCPGAADGMPKQVLRSLGAPNGRVTLGA